MIGLPYESQADLEHTVKFLNKHNIQGLKIHCTYVVENTVLADMLKNGEYNPISLEYYLESVSYVLTHISPDIVIHRVSGDAPKDLLIAPIWSLYKRDFFNTLHRHLKQTGEYQGQDYGNISKLREI